MDFRNEFNSSLDRIFDAYSTETDEGKDILGQKPMKWLLLWLLLLKKKLQETWVMVS